jgi:hypothetical protein
MQGADEPGAAEDAPSTENEADGRVGSLCGHLLVKA